MLNYLRILVTIIIIVSSITGCKREANDNCPNKVTLQLNWTDDPTFTGEYVAKEKFWFLKKLDVTLKQGGLGVDPISMVISKKAQFAVVGADKALIAIADNKPIKVISVDLQRNPVGWIARQELKIINFEDIRGRTDIILGDKAGTEISAILDLVLRKKKLNVSPRPVSFDFSYFLANENVVYPVYLNEEPIKAEVVHGIKVNELDPSSPENGGIKLYGNVLIAHSDTIKECPGIVEKFVSGLSSGWDFAKNNTDETLSIVLKYVKNDKEYVRRTMNRTVEFATNMYGNPVPPGHMEYTAWESTVALLKETGLLNTDIDLKKCYLPEMTVDNNIWKSDIDSYLQIKTESRKFVLYPRLLDLVKGYSPCNVLDFGCGDGGFSYLLSENKAINIALYDSSDSALSIARKKLSAIDVEFYDSPNHIPKNKFDIVVFSLVLMTIGDEKDIISSFRNIVRSKKEDGYVFVAVTHPCFRQYKFSTFKTEYANGKPFMYFDNGEKFKVTLIDPEINQKVSFYDYHWSLEKTSSFIEESGMVINKIIEPSDSSNGRFSFNEQFPPYLIFVCS